MTAVNNISAGIDYSMTSPAICIWDTKKSFSFKNTFNFNLNTSKKYKDISTDNIKITFLNNKTWVSQEERFDKISAWAIDLLQSYKVKDVYLEDYAFAARGRVFNIGENTGVLKNKILKSEMSLVTIPPTVIKKAATGKGNANKEKMEESFKMSQSIDIKKITGQTAKQWNPSSDIIDAFFILKTGLENKLH